VLTWAPLVELDTEPFDDASPDDPVVVPVGVVAVAAGLGVATVAPVVEPSVDAVSVPEVADAVEAPAAEVDPVYVPAASAPRPPVAATPARAVPTVIARSRHRAR
jgi:hypothetical protein